MGRIVLGFCFGIMLSSCLASNLFPFRYYSLLANSYEGMLLGPSSDQDLLLRICAPNEGNKAPCMVMLTSEFLRLKQDHTTCQLALDAAQRRCE
jgi:hypothetical protein